MIKIVNNSNIFLWKERLFYENKSEFSIEVLTENKYFYSIGKIVKDTT